MKEAHVQSWVQKYLKEAFGPSIYIFKVPQGQYTSRKGIPDLVCGIRGLFFAIEVKTQHGKLTPLQKHEIELINNSGCMAFTIYGKDKILLDTFIRKINESENSKL